MDETLSEFQGILQYSTMYISLELLTTVLCGGDCFMLH